MDARAATTGFSLYHAIFDGLVDESVPTQGIRTDALLTQLRDALAPPSRRAVVAVDHVGESETYSLSALVETLAPLDDDLAWAAIGRDRPTELDRLPPVTRFEVPAYDTQTPADIVTSRAMAGPDARVLTHRQCGAIAAWANGYAHDALAVLFAAADRAADRGRSRIDGGDVARARDSIPRPSVPLAQVLTLAPNRQQVLRALLDVEADNCSSVEETAAAIAADVDPVRTAEFLLTIVDGIIVEATTRTDDPRERLWESLSEYIETHVVAQQQGIEFASWRQRPGRLMTGGT